MPLPQDVTPLNSDVLDTVVKPGEMEWTPTVEDQAWIKVLWTGSESGSWAAIFRWKKGYAAGTHKHLSAAHVLVLSGKLQVRDAILHPGDYIYEPNGMLHDLTTALEDTEYLFICNGPLIFHDDDNFTGYLSWEELERIRRGANAELISHRSKTVPLSD